ncbi:MAG: hypothetical protein Q8L76_00440, partial [Cypionkella sp.]|nr:hypothetical protein [Cypionkella sp.]
MAARCHAECCADQGFLLNNSRFGGVDELRTLALATLAGGHWQGCQIRFGATALSCLAGIGCGSCVKHGVSGHRVYGHPIRL